MPNSPMPCCQLRAMPQGPGDAEPPLKVWGTLGACPLSFQAGAVSELLLGTCREGGTGNTLRVGSARRNTDTNACGVCGWAGEWLLLFVVPELRGERDTKMGQTWRSLVPMAPA